MNDVHFVMLLVFLVVVDIMALNFEILHTVDWLQHKEHINYVVKVANVISMTILCIFFLEVTLRCYANPRKFFKKRFNLIDMGVVYVSVILESILLAIPLHKFCEDDGHDAAGSHRLLSSSSGSHSACSVNSYSLTGFVLLTCLIFLRIGRVGHAFYEVCVFMMKNR